ncbi:hypothetical protein L2719_07240 [Shewanella schlegeliana]|uniref:Uncharacterized protein n=1 Tax=Shewanella schlegeliana TaxID=190308 RepID=A0ABS1SXW2_9GAMM|nr:hypothetical protein [Shewanella schlegeliana]MBL4913383.1 hypothetical protein [Shewanella schlegeliana]MCL1109338.1 hypothetical protein [Shewanella schlegeliana]GIU38126.1 hypothetical protein TUM4433_39360 [Shewanella schlegeliana]
MPTNNASIYPLSCRLSVLFSAAVLTCAALFSPASYAKQECSFDALEAMENDSGFFRGFTSAVCKQLPHQEQFTMGAYLQWTGGSFAGERRYTLRTVIMDTQTHEIIARHTGSLSERPGLIVEPGAQADQVNPIQAPLWIDTANYKLNSDTRALGVRIMAQQHPDGAMHYESDYLSLFVHQGRFLIPMVEKLPLYYWKIWQNEQSSYNPARTSDVAQSEASDKSSMAQRYIVETGKAALHIEAKQHRGFADLKLLTKTKLSGALPKRTDSTQSRTIITRLRFDGEGYYILDSGFGDKRDWQSTERWWKPW